MDAPPLPAATDSGAWDQSGMEAWLRQQAEKAQARVVITRSADSSGGMRYFSVQRLTNSDVVSVVTTTRVSGAEVEDKLESSQRKTHLREPQYTSPLRNEEILRREERERRNKALWREADIFMSRLQKKRSERERAEVTAALKIQSQFRGWRWRKFIKREKKKKTVRARLRTRIKFLNKSMGMVIQEREKKERILEMKKRAVRDIQKLARGFLARRAAAKERQMLQEEVLIMLATRIQCMARRRLARRAVKLARQRHRFARQFTAATAIQRHYRGRIGRKEFWARSIALSHVAATLCQRRFRIYVARKALRKERERVALAKMNRGAVGVQAMWRGKLARRRVFEIRNKETRMIREAATLAIQRVYRGSLGKRLAKDIMFREDEEDEMLAAIEIQRIVRSYFGRREFRAEADRQLTNIFDQARLGNHEAVKDLLAGYNLPAGMEYTIDSVDEEGNTVLLVAARWGHKRICKHALRRGMDINAVNDEGRTAVELAVKYGHEDTADYLIEKAAEVNFFGRTLLHEAACQNMTRVIVGLIGHGMPLDEQDPEGLTALHEAAVRENMDTLQLLIDRAASLDVRDKRGWTPVMLAAAEGKAQSVLLLVNSGCDVSIKDSEGRTAWRLALSNEHPKCAQLLRSAWAEVVGAEHEEVAAMAASEEDRTNIWNYTIENSDGKVEDILDRGLPADFRDDDENTVLMVAARANADRVVRLLIRKGADVRRANRKGQTALHWAAEHEELAATLVMEGAEINAVDDDMRTPIHEAAKHGWVYESSIHEMGLDVNMEDYHGWTPLHDAAAAAKLDCCNALLRLGARVMVLDKQGETPLHKAAVHKDGSSTCEFLVQRGSNVNHQNSAGDAALHLALRKELVHNVTMLLEGGADPSLPSGAGESPARIACQLGNSTLLALVLQYGANPQAVDGDGRTALAVAILEHSTDCVSLLIQHGADVMEEYADGSSPMHLCAQTGWAEGVPMLMSATAMGQFLLAKTNNRGDTPIATGLRSGRDGALQALLEAGSELPPLPLHLAAAAQHSHAIRWLFSVEGVNPKEVDKNGGTALHVAAHVDRVANLRALIEGGVDENQANKLGHTVLDVASRSRAYKSVEYLTNKGPPTADEEDYTGSAEIMIGRASDMKGSNPFAAETDDVDESDIMAAMGF